MKKIVFLASVLVLFSTIMIVRLIRPVEASGTIYIKADGSVSPSTAKISSFDNVTYTFTDNNYDSFVVQIDNIVVDGAGYTLQGKGVSYSKGIDLTGRRNVTIRNMEIRKFFFGIWLKTSSNNTIFGNNINLNKVGIWLSDSSCNTISGNNVTANMDYNIYLEYSSSNSILGNSIAAHKVWVSYLYYSFFGIYLYHSSSNSISGNNVTNSDYGIQISLSSNNNTIFGNSIRNNTYGILIWKSSTNTIYGNDAIGNDYGIVLTKSSKNTIYHDNFMNNTKQAYSHNSTNFWDDGYPSGGNYWSNYKDRYPDAEEMDESGIWDTPYVIDESNQDNYPLTNSWIPEQEALPLAAEEVPLWMQLWLWATVAVGILVLAGAFYFFLKKKTVKTSSILTAIALLVCLVLGSLSNSLVRLRVKIDLYGNI